MAEVNQPNETIFEDGATLDFHKSDLPLQWNPFVDKALAEAVKAAMTVEMQQSVNPEVNIHAEEIGRAVPPSREVVAYQQKMETQTTVEEHMAYLLGIGKFVTGLRWQTQSDASRPEKNPYLQGVSQDDFALGA